MSGYVLTELGTLQVENDNLRAENARLREALNALLDEFEGEPVYRHHRGKYEEWQVAPEAIDDARRAVGRAVLHPEEGSSS